MAAKLAKNVKKKSRIEFNLNRTSVLLIGLIFLIIAAIYLGRGLFVAATVNGEIISRIAIIKQLESQSGRQVVDSQITEKLIRQEVKRQGVELSAEELSTRTGQIEQSIAMQGQNFDELLAAQGLTRTDFENQIELQLLVERLFEGQINVDEAKIETYLVDNTLSFPEELGEPERRMQAMEALRQEELGTKIRDLIQRLRSEAEIKFFVNY